MLEVYSKSGAVSDYSWGKDGFDAQKARWASGDFDERGIKSLFSPTDGKTFPHMFFWPLPWPSGGACLTSGPTFVTLRPWKRTLSASDSARRPGGPKAISYQLRMFPPMILHCSIA
jgi:hypothetical protein